jgi:membrane protease YdiL (CAAX protease family)
LNSQPSNTVCATPTKAGAWCTVLAITVLNSVILGLGCFVWLGAYLRRRMDLFHSAVYQQLGFAAGLAIVLAIVVVWQRACGVTLADVGYRRPTTKLALALAVILGVAYLAGCYFVAPYVLPESNILELNWVRFALAPVGIFMAFAEEAIMRGYFMTVLDRAKVGTAKQIFASGACSAVYHALQNPTAEGFFPAFMLFSMHAGLYVLGRRSLTPTVVAHSMYHVFGEPYLLMMVLTTMRM